MFDYYYLLLIDSNTLSPKNKTSRHAVWKSYLLSRSSKNEDSLHHNYNPWLYTFPNQIKQIKGFPKFEQESINIIITIIIINRTEIRLSDYYAP